MIEGSHRWDEVSGWVFIISAALAWYVATALLLAGTTGRMVLPLGVWRRDASSQMSGAAFDIPWAEPGIKHGQ